MKNAILFLCLVTLITGLGCAIKRNSLIVGRLPIQAKCVAIMPFNSIGDSGEMGDEFLSEFMASDLFREGFTEIVYARDIRKILNELNIGISSLTDKEQMINLAKFIGVDAIIWGALEYQLIIEQVREGDQNVRVLSIDAYLGNVNTGDINWYYNTKKTFSARDSMKTLAEISSEMSWGLLRDRGKKPIFLVDGCNSEIVLTKFKSYFGQQKRKPQEIVMGAQASPVEQKIEPSAASKGVLSEDEMKIFNSLTGGEKITLGQLRFEGRTANISKDGMIFLKSVGSILKSLGSGYKFRFESHVDATNDTAADMTVSLEMAKSIKSFLTDYASIADSAIEIKAYGGQVPLLPNINKRSREKNKRIELSAVKIDR
jgi:outer membrane protein OmpA-like peptidoglycan-associated protein